MSPWEQDIITGKFSPQGAVIFAAASTIVRISGDLKRHGEKPQASNNPQTDKAQRCRGSDAYLVLFHADRQNRVKHRLQMPYAIF